jgi:glycosyltransferase involved in cell wall biosynthesis
MIAASHRRRARELAKLGVQLTVVVPREWEYQRFESGPDEGYELQVSPIAFASPALGRLANHTFYYRQISRIIRREPWDLVHIDEEPFNFACYHAAKLCARTRLRWIFFSWQNIFKSYPFPFNAIEKSAFENASAAIAGNVEAKEVLRRRGFAKPVKVVPQFGIDPDFFRKVDTDRVRKRLGLRGAFIVGYIGRIVEEKGLDTLICAFANLPRESNLVLVGSGPFKTRLEGLIRCLGLSQRTQWVTWVNSSQVSEYMNAFDVLVLSSRTTANWKEQFGRVLVEAMACETCVIGSDSGEIKNVVGDAGLVFREGDDRELAVCLTRLKYDSCLREALGRRGRARVLEHFSYSKIANDTLSLYKQVCSDDPAPAECASGAGVSGAALPDYP